INDTYGHDVGDKVLIDLCAFISSIISNKDRLFRIGGEEFLILMNDTHAQQAIETAETLCTLIEKLPFIEGNKITISAGIAEIEAGITWKEWMKHSDNKLYTAKRSGRNRVIS
ncbi:MAG: GGDEF domain-containing protein, partial [Paraglaciecola sp.]|nr:GGDEF domain-containing protein [Paraglaciecola sp.]